MRTSLAMIFAVLLHASDAFGACACRCVDGEVRALCDSSIDIEPICAPRLCPIAPPSIAPVTPPRLPPLGTSSCFQRQVLNPGTGRYEWQQVCE